VTYLVALVGGGFFEFENTIAARSIKRNKNFYFF